MEKENYEEFLHNQVWTRFIHKPYNHLVDYADEDGNASIPSGEECKNGIPTVMGWATPIADGAFFTGLYLYGLCVRDEKIRKSAKADTDAAAAVRKEEILKLMNGLFLLDDVSPVDGFIARGVASDGVSHYPYRSEDQFGPWVLGLWKLYNTDLPSAETKEKIRVHILRAIAGMKRTGYDIPTEIEQVTRGSFAHDDWRGVCKLLFCMAVEVKLTGDPDALREYQSLCEEHPDGSIFSRLEIASHGFANDMVRDTSLIQFWIDICAHLCLRALGEADPAHKEYFDAGRRSNAFCTSAFLKDVDRFNQEHTVRLNMNWRELLPEMRPWHSPDEAVAEAGRVSSL
ncbi:MAG: hypothetical protein MJ078_07160, partial [Clostridia bacterium]|nr:hypothetical protein [Clostridia bacterium]